MYWFFKDNYPTHVIWSFIRFFRTILSNLDLLNNGKTKNEILRNIWPFERKPNVIFTAKIISKKDRIHLEYW